MKQHSIPRVWREGAPPFGGERSRGEMLDGGVVLALGQSAGAMGPGVVLARPRIDPAELVVVLARVVCPC